MSARERQAQDEALARMLQLEEHGSHRTRQTSEHETQPQQRSGSTREHNVRALTQERSRRLTTQELRDLELARQFERFAVFSGSQRPSSTQFTDQRERDITVARRNVNARGVVTQLEGQIPSENMALSELRGIESSLRSQTIQSQVSGHILSLPGHHRDRRARDGGLGGSDSSLQVDLLEGSKLQCQAHTAVNSASRLTRDHASWDLSTPPRFDGSDLQHRRSLSIDEPLAYARMLQEQAFAVSSVPVANAAQSNSRSVVDTDLEIARKMQELEDQGLGRLNSERKFLGNECDDESDSDESDTKAGFALPSSMMNGPYSKGARPSQEEEDAKLARFMEESGASIRDLSEDQLNSVLDGGRNAPVVPAPSTVPTRSDPSCREVPAQRDGTIPNVGSISSTVPQRASVQSTPSTPVFNYSERNHHESSSQLPSLNPLSDDVFLDVPLKEKKKKKGWFIGRCDKKSHLASPLPNQATISSLRVSGIPAAIPPPPGGSISIPPPSSPRRLVGMSHPMSPPPTTLPHPSSPVATPQTAAPSAPSSARVIGPRPSVGRSWAPSSPRKASQRPDGTGWQSESAPPAALRPGPLPHSVSVSRNLAPNASAQTSCNVNFRPPVRGSVQCANCRQSGGSFVAALDKKYHVECFRCLYCNERIDSTAPFSFSQNDQGEKHPYHRKCFAELYGVKCAVCSETIPANYDGTVTFVKHPFFDSEQMCPRHAENPGRRCTGCHRFEPMLNPFADLNDGDRCVCFSCCRTVVVDNADVSPLWDRVLDFFEHKLQLPVWKEMREIPILVVQSDALSDQLQRSENSAHKGSSQIMARGLCLTDHDPNRRFKLPSLRFINSSRSFEAIEDHGFTYYEVSPSGGRGNPNSNVFAILCLSGLPRDLTTSVLAHEATHAWIKLHPQYDARKPLPAQVEEGCAQLVAMLLLNDGLDPATDHSAADSLDHNSDGPSDEKLRQYFKFSIERDHDDVYGGGYRKAARAYRDIGIEALLSHVVRYRQFPTT